MLALPDELLHCLVQYLAYEPALPDQGSLTPNSERVSFDLLSLSQVNCQLRRLSLPFLLAYVHIKYFRHLDRLKGLIRSNADYAKLIR